MADRGEQTFEVNGQVYRSLDEVPQPFRDSLAAMLADRDGDGVPDLFEGGSSQVISHTTQTFEVDGVAYSSIDEVPAADRARVAAAFERLTAESSAEPAARRGGGHTPSLANPGRATTPPPSAIVTKAGWSGRTKMLIAFVAMDAVAAAVIVWLLTR